VAVTKSSLEHSLTHFTAHARARGFCAPGRATTNRALARRIRSTGAFFRRVLTRVAVIRAGI